MFTQSTLWTLWTEFRSFATLAASSQNCLDFGHTGEPLHTANKSSKIILKLKSHKN